LGTRLGTRDRRAGSGWSAVLVAVVLVAGAAGCGLGSDDESAAEDAGGESAGHLQVPDGDDRGEGCGDEVAETPTDDLAANRTVARCAPESPEAVPLGEPTTLKVGVRGMTEDLAPLLLADALGELEAEDLTVEIQAFEDATTLWAALDAGEIDAVAGDLDAPFFDLVAEHGQADTPGPRLVMGGPIATSPNDLSVAQAGFWVRPSLLEKPNQWRDLEDQPVAVEDSIADVVSMPITALLRQDDLSLNEVRIRVIGPEEAAQQLVDAELAAAWLPDPYWQQVADDDEVELVATLPVSESLGGVVVAPDLVSRRRDVGVAFTRALVRTINTYLPGDYQDDDEVMDALAEATGADVDELRSTPAWVFDWELRTDTTTRIQTPMLQYGAVLYESELPESRIVDRTLYAEAVNGPPDAG
jgi:NitT/TauT family transport system substrate-binding protein